VHIRLEVKQCLVKANLPSPSPLHAGSTAGGIARIAARACRSANAFCLKKGPILIFLVTKLKKMGRAHTKSQNRPQVRFGR